MAASWTLSSRLDINLASTLSKTGLFSAGSASDVIALVKNLATFSLGPSGSSVARQFYDNQNPASYTMGTNITDQLQGSAAWTNIKIFYINNLSGANTMTITGTLLAKLLPSVGTVTIGVTGSLVIVNPTGYPVANGDVLTIGGTTPSFEIALIGS